MEQNIVIERHYLTPQMYREIYLGYPYYFTNRYPQPQPQLQPHSYSPFINQNPILAPSNNQGLPVFHQPNINTNTLNQTNNNVAQNNNVNRSTHTHTTTNNNPDTLLSNPPGLGNPQASAEIRNLINSLINNNTPFQLEVSTLPITRILNQFRTTINANEDNDNNNSNINLANINNISSVNVFSSLNINTARSNTNSTANSNTTEEICSICQTDFEDPDIVRRLNNCGHLFHLNCVDTWLSNHSTCPTCRNELTENMTENMTANNAEDQDEDDDELYEDEDDEEGEDEEDEEDQEDDDESQTCQHYCNCHEDYTDCEDDENTEDDELPNSNTTYTLLTSNHIVDSQANNSSNSSQSASQAGIINNNSNIHIFTSSSIFGGDSVPGTAFGEFQNDINHIINLGTPLINTIMGTNNTSSQLNSTHINGQVNNMINAINPLLAAFSNMIINGANNNQRS